MKNRYEGSAWAALAAILLGAVGIVIFHAWVDLNAPIAEHQE